MKTVILIGDSIRMGYQATVQSELSELADVWGPEQNGGTSRNVLDHLDEWLISRKPDIVHINCGLHDLRRQFGQSNAVPIDEYEKNVRQILGQLKSQQQTTVIWATTTPVNEKWHHDIKKFDRFEADVSLYNATSTRIAKELDVTINPLFNVGEEVVRAGLLKEDGVHFLPEGSVKLGKAVAQFIKSHL